MRAVIARGAGNTPAAVAVRLGGPRAVIVGPAAQVGVFVGIGVGVGVGVAVAVGVKDAVGVAVGVAVKVAVAVVPRWQV